MVIHKIVQGSVIASLIFNTKFFVIQLRINLANHAVAIFK